MTTMAPFYGEEMTKQAPAQVYNCFVGVDGSTYFGAPTSPPMDVPTSQPIYQSMTNSPPMMYGPQQYIQPMYQQQQQPSQPAMYVMVPQNYSSNYSSCSYSPVSSSTSFQYSPNMSCGASLASGSSPTMSRASTPSSTGASSGAPGAYDTNGESISTKLELIWNGEFSSLFGHFMHNWSLVPVEDPKTIDNDVFKSYMDSAKVRFSCPTCGNCWTSMKGRVYFLYTLDNTTCQGLVYFKLFGQKCQKCADGDYVHSMWYPDEIVKVISNIYQKVGASYYGFSSPLVRVDRRRGQPKKPHPLMACQACDMGICKEEHNFR